MRRIAIVFCLLSVFALVTFRLLTVKTPRLFRSLPDSSLPAIYPTGKPALIPDLPPIQPVQALDRIFSADHSWTASLSAQHVRTILATGDIIPGRSVNYLATKYNNFLWPWEKVTSILKQADITFVNLEAPLIAGCQPTPIGMTFCGDPRNIAGFSAAGVDVANLANNHSTNYGPAGIESTTKILEANGILATGLNGPVYKEVRGIRFAFLGYDDIPPLDPFISLAEENKIKAEISQSRRQADVVVVTFHWGVEYTSQPTARQVSLAHLAVDSGANLVIGNHPHWIQALEIYKGVPVMYAHGNFIFDQEWSEKTKLGVVGRYTFDDKKLVDIEYLPIKIENYGQTHFLEGAEKQKVLTDLRNESIILRRSF